MNDAEPERFGPYRVEEVLGRGGMGVVHRAYDTVHERYVALKRLPATAGDEFRARFRREAAIVAGLDVPHVVPIHAHGEIDGQLYRSPPGTRPAAPSCTACRRNHTPARRSAR